MNLVVAVRNVRSFDACDAQAMRSVLAPDFGSMKQGASELGGEAERGMRTVDVDAENDGTGNANVEADLAPQISGLCEVEQEASVSTMLCQGDEQRIQIRTASVVGSVTALVDELLSGGLADEGAAQWHGYGCAERKGGGTYEGAERHG